MALGSSPKPTNLVSSISLLRGVRARTTYWERGLFGAGCMSLCQPVIWSMAAILRDSTVVVVAAAVVAAAVVRTHPRAIL